MMTQSSTANEIQGTLLAVDTSTSHMSVALMRDGILQGELNSNAEKNHSIHLLPHIRQLLNASDLQPQQLNAFAVGVGPGSYTGVRIGVTVAKTFAWTHGMALIAVSSLAAMALGGLEAYYLRQGNPVSVSGHEEGGGRTPSSTAAPELNRVGGTALDLVQKQSGTSWVIPMIEARRGQAFTGLYQVSGHRFSQVVPDGIRLMSSWVDELLDRVQQAGESERPLRIVFAGETKLHGAVLASFFERWTGESAEVPHELRASHLAELGQRLWSEGYTEDPHGLVPNYTQLTEAEVNLLAKSSGRA